MTFEINFSESYPSAKRVNQTDNYHGTNVSDPYRYMEDPNNSETKEFVVENNKLYDKFIDSNQLEKFRTIFKNYVSFPVYTIPVKVSDNYYYTKNDGMEPQGKYYCKNISTDKTTELFDFNSLNEDGTTSPLITKLSPDGKLLAVVSSKHGSDWHNLLIINLENGSIAESIPWVNFTQVHWLDDSSGFYYTRFPDQSNLPLEKQRKGQKLYFHTLGSKVTTDKLIFKPSEEVFGANFDSSSDGTWLFITSTKSTMPENKLLYMKVASQEGPATIIPDLDGNSYKIIDVVNNYAYCLTSWNAPNKRIMKFSLDNPHRDQWVEVIAESQYNLEGASIANNQLVLIYIEDVKHELYLYSLGGQEQVHIDLPTVGSVLKDYNRSFAIECHKNESKLFFTFNSFFIPPTIYQYDFETNKVFEFFGETLPIDKDKYKIKQVFYSSKDGTKIPMFILHTKDMKINGNNKTVLFGYGGYNIALSPFYSPRFLSWLDNGGVYAIANLRGGGEYGKKWHFQGILDKKQNVFDDFIAAAEWLIKQNYTNSKKLAINGRSNGGLLVGACMIQKPDLFGVAVPEVGVLDMLRFKHFQAGRYWTAEYGDAEKNADHFDFLMKYSPLHNVDKNTHYPPTLIVTAEADDRVVPMHTKKFTAALQQAQKAKNPILMRIETKAGHGFGKSIHQQIDDNAYVFAFIDQIFTITDKL